MIIIYIEEDQAAVMNRMGTLKKSFFPATISRMEHRKISLISGLKFYVIKKDEVDRIRGLQPLAVFVNCYLDLQDRAGIESMVRKT